MEISCLWWSLMGMLTKVKGKNGRNETMYGKIIQPFCEWLFLFAVLMFIYTDDRHILPSKDITMIETSSWYRRRSPCGMSSNSWKAIPAKPNIHIKLYSFIK